MSALPSLVQMFPPSSSTIAGAVAFDDTIYVPPARGSRPTLENAFRRWSMPENLDETRAGAPKRKLSYEVYPPGRSSRDVATVRQHIPERPARTRWLYAGVVLLGVFVSLFTVVAVAALRDDSAPVAATHELRAVPQGPLPVPAVMMGSDFDIPGLIAPPPPPPPRYVKPGRGKGTIARK